MVSLVSTDLRSAIEAAFADPQRLDQPDSRDAVETTIAGLDRGEIRLAEKLAGEWIVNAWVQQAILLYFRLRQLDRKSTRLNSSHEWISYAVFCLKKKKNI